MSNANTPAVCNVDALRAYARGRLGLIIGPGATSTDPGFWNTIADAVAAKLTAERRSTYYEIAEQAVERGTPYETAREAVAESVSNVAASPMLSQLARIRWTAVLSGTLDDHLETRLEQEHARRPARADVSVISTPHGVPRGGTLAVYKVVGSAQRRDLAVTTADTLRRTAALGPICRDFVELVKASPVLCVGMDGAQWLLNPLLAQLFAQRGGGPAKLIVLAGDPLGASPTIRQLVPPHALVIADGALMDVAKSIEPVLANRQTTFSFSGSSGKPESLDLTAFADIVVPLNAHLEPAIQAHERDRLLDYLFMPDVLNWDAFLHDFDFPRTLVARVVNDLPVNNADSSVSILHGRAGSGKTTVLKRVAIDLAKRGDIVCWLKDYWYGDVGDRIEKFLQRFAQLAPNRQLTVILDASTCTLEEPLNAFLRSVERSGVPTRLLVATRTSSLPEVEADLRDAGIEAEDVWDLPDGLDDEEWSRLPAYLVKLGVCRDLEHAAKQVQQASANKNSRDTLAVLYWLLPQTRQAISRSVEHEYVTLGDSARLSSIVEGIVGGAAGALKDAYGMVAVSVRYGLALPIEVLASALNINYADWLEAVGEKGTAWGLFYPADDQDLEGASYRTRNEVVTGIILRTINGGTLRRTGEVEYLRRLLAACTGTSAIYAQYAERLLVRNKTLQGLSLSDGVSLYTAAEAALPHQSKTLLHHKGLWIKRHGGDLDEALRAMDAALSAPPAPHSDRTEADEHIHTSKAATIIDKLDQRKVSEEDGKTEALLELEKSRSPNFINPHATHVYAGLVSRLAFGRGVLDPVDRFDLVNRALADVDRMVSLLRAGGIRRRTAGTDLEFLESRRAEIVEKCVDADKLADELWDEKRSQLGFVVGTRKRLSKAIGRDDAGTTYKEAFDYWSDAHRRIESAGIDIAPEFAEVGLLLYYSWQVEGRSRKRIRSNTNLIQWDLLRVLAEKTFQSKRLQRDPFYRFIYGLSLSHLHEWALADLAFAKNRELGLPGDILHAPRSYLLHPEGTPWKLQGNVKPGPNNSYFDAVDLRRQFMTMKSESWPRGTAQQHGYVIFSFAGPRATRSDDLCRKASG